eukprot:scaffold48558_cov54-Phaeocystis_antarctica.AAC.3
MGWPGRCKDARGSDRMYSATSHTTTAYDRQTLNTHRLQDPTSTWDPKWAGWELHCMNNEPHNEGISHCESSLFNNEGIGAHCSNNEPNNEPPARFWEIISP